MFRITRGMHVQHIQFPFPVLGPREPDGDDGEAPPDRDAPGPEASTTAREETAEDAAG